MYARELVRAFLLTVVAACLLSAAATAHGAARQQTNTTLVGQYGPFHADACAAHTVTAPGPINGLGNVTPAAGSVLLTEDGKPLDVSAGRTDSGGYAWTIAPRQPCDQTGAWQSEPARLGFTYRASRYTITAPATGPLRSIAGYYPDRDPSPAGAQRALGRAHIHKVRYGCRLTWPKLGLNIDFVNYGGGDPCRDGYAQSAAIRGPRLGRWAVKVGDRAAVGDQVTVAYLQDAGLLASVRAIDPRTVALARIFLPYGDNGYYATVAGHYNRDHYIDRLSLWIGRGGE